MKNGKIIGLIGLLAMLQLIGGISFVTAACLLVVGKKKQLPSRKLVKKNPLVELTDH